MKNKLYTTINEFKKSLLNPINEGQFSWFTQDTHEQIGSETTNTIEVYMYDNNGNKWFEPDYEGYGEFGGKDYYELLAEMNGYIGGNRETGIDLAFNNIKTKNADDILLYPALVSNPNMNVQEHDFTVKPEADPNQSWQMQDEDDDDDYEEDEYDEDMYESKTTLPKVGSIVKINKDVDLISLSKIKNQKLLVVKHKDVGLTETPKFVIVKDKDNKEHSINPKYISIVK